MPLSVRGCRFRRRRPADPSAAGEEAQSRAGHDGGDFLFVRKRQR